MRLLGSDFDFTALTEVDDAIRRQILADLAPARIAQGLGDLDSDDAVRILEDLEDAEQEEVLSALPIGEQIQLRRSLDYPEESAGRLMQTEFVAVPAFWSVGQTIDYMREEEELPEFHELFVIDPAHKLVGAVPLKPLLAHRAALSPSASWWTRRATWSRPRLTARRSPASSSATTSSPSPSSTIPSAWSASSWSTTPLDVIQEEAEEDIRRLSGVGDEEISDSRARDRAEPASPGSPSTSRPPSWPRSSSASSRRRSSRWWRWPCSCPSSPRWAATRPRKP